jgi:hypothetical protein
MAWPTSSRSWAAVAAVKPNVEVHGIIGAENMPDGDAYRPATFVPRTARRWRSSTIPTPRGRPGSLADVPAYGRSVKFSSPT